MNYTEYDSNSGRFGGVHRGYSSSTEVLPNLFIPGMDAVVEGEYGSQEFYILNGQPTERPASPVTLSDLTLQGVPAGSTLTINGESYDAEGDVELEFPLSGTYQLRVECWPYKDWEGEVTV